MTRVLVTGSAGLVGSAAVTAFADAGRDVIGIDNNFRAELFGPEASTLRTRESLEARYPSYRHHDIDLRDDRGVERVLVAEGRDLGLVVHTAAQPSHDWAAGAPAVDFAINAAATLHLLEMVRQNAPQAVFIYVSTNKVYGDLANSLPLVEGSTRWEVDQAHRYAKDGIDESMSIDQSAHSLFGCSKLSADLMVQEYGRAFGMRTACFRCGCITGGAHAAVEQHGFLAYLAKCAVSNRPYVIHGYGGKQVRDNLHAGDLVAAFAAFEARPRSAEVYNMGGGRSNSCSVREAIASYEALIGNPMTVSYDDTARRGDHIWWISDYRKFQTHYPEWAPKNDLTQVIESVLEGAKQNAR